MLRHIVLLKWVDGVTAEQEAEVSAALDRLPPAIASIRRYTHGPDLDLDEGRYDYAIVADFDDADGWRVYDVDDLHNEIRASVIRPLLAGRATVQFGL